VLIEFKRQLYEKPEFGGIESYGSLQERARTPGVLTVDVYV
jgi:hypothetical protein